MKPKYAPQPIDTRGVALPKELDELVELLAQNVHEVWAQARMGQGWVYGPKRDDEQKKHPCLVPYDSLPETEKDYDRNTAVETIKLILKLGYQIKKHTS